jgi:large subunit ribosomal protein L24
MALKFKIRKGDKVVVRTGRDKGKVGEVLRIFPEDSRALVQGINLVRRHQKQTPGKEGGIISKEMPIHISNIALRDPKDNKPSKVGYKVLKDGKKVRFARKSGEVIDG